MHQALTIRAQEEAKALRSQARSPRNIRARSILVNTTKSAETQARLLEKFGYDFSQPNLDCFGAPQL